MKLPLPFISVTVVSAVAAVGSGDPVKEEYWVVVSWLYTSAQAAATNWFAGRLCESQNNRHQECRHGA